MLEMGRFPSEGTPVCRGGKQVTEWSMEIASQSPADRPGIRPKKDTGRSRITNGSALLPGVDGRSPWVRRCKDIIASHLSDMGGVDNTSAAERSLVRRAAVMTTELEMLEAKFATAGSAKPDDLDLYVRASGNLRRLLEAVGLQRRAREVGKFVDGRMTNPVPLPSQFRTIDEAPA
jgi:hypothetical protein